MQIAVCRALGALMLAVVTPCGGSRALSAQTAERTPAPTPPRDVMLMDRIGPSSSTLIVGEADGSAERPLTPASGFDYHATVSADGRWIVFTSERNRLGQADIYRVHVDG